MTQKLPANVPRSKGKVKAENSVWAAMGYGEAVSNKRERVERLVGPPSDEGMDPHYRSYFDCFNRGQYFEAHEVLEPLWLNHRQGANGAFYKGLIQLAGAFVHLQKGRLRPSAALFKLAGANLRRYTGTHEQLSLPPVLALVEHWLGLLERGACRCNPFQAEPAPSLRLNQIPASGNRHHPGLAGVVE
jgi:hypothetical protein